MSSSVPAGVFPGGGRAGTKGGTGHAGDGVGPKGGTGHTGDGVGPKGGTGRRGRTGGGWAAVSSVALASLALVLSELLPVGLLPDVRDTLGVSAGTTGLLVVVPGLVAALVAPVLPVAMRDLDRRLVLLAVAGLVALSNAICAVAGGLAVMLAGRVLLGVAVGGFWTMGAGVAHRLVAAPSADRATSLITAGVSVGTVVTLPLGALIGQSGSWRAAFVLAFVLSMVALAAQAVLLPPIPVPAAVRWQTLRAFVAGRVARAGLVVTALLFLGNFAAGTYVMPYLREELRVGTSAVTGIALVYGLAGVAGNFAAGYAVGRRLRGTLLTAAVAMAAGLVLLPAMTGAPATATVLLVAWGAAFGAVPVSLQTWTIRTAAAGAEGGLAIFMSVTQVALAGGSFAGGMMVDGYGVTSAMLLGAVLAAAGATVLAGVRAPAPPSG